MTMPKFEPLYIIFDGPPDHNAPHFVEVETDAGLSIRAGEWKQRGDYWTLGPFCASDRLTEAYEAGKREQADELEAARAEIERKMSAGQFVLEQLAAEQAKNVGMRELVEHFALIDLGRSLLPDDFGLWVLRARKAISAPSDTSALEAIVKKAGEVMRERCAAACAGPNEDWNIFADDAGLAIRSLPAVTLEDLK